MLKNLTTQQIQRVMIALFIVVVLLGIVYQAPAHVVTAQGGQTLPFDALQLGVVNGPQGVAFTFIGQAGDAVEIETAGLNNFAPVIVLQGPDGAVVAQEPNTTRSDSVTLNATLPSSGTYTIVITGADGTVGQFTILLTRGLPVGFPLIPNGTTEGIVAPTIPQIYYDLPLDQINNTRLEVRSLTFGYSPQVTIFGADGTVIAIIGGNRALAGSLEFGPGTETLKVLVAIGEFQNQASIDVNWTVVTVDTDGPVNTPEPSQSNSTGGCQVTPNSNNPVNVRAGGSTDHTQVGVLQANQFVPVTGVSSLNGGWYEIQLSTVTVGWVASFVVSTSGNCSSLPTKTFPPAQPSGGTTPGQASPTPNITSTATVTLAPGQATFTPTSTATLTATPTATQPTQAQIAPADDQQITFELNAGSANPSDRTVSVNGVISFPNGDTADRIRYDITGFSQSVFSAEVLVTVTCSGPGSENALIASNFGRSPVQSCNGYSRTFTHTNDSDFQNHEIWLESGSDAFVSWTLTATIIN